MRSTSAFLFLTLVAGISLVHTGSVVAGGGDDCNTATEIFSLPFTDTGDTGLFFNIYDEFCPAPSSSPDTVYQYSSSVPQCIDVSLCGSSFDTKMYIYGGPLGPCPPPGVGGTGAFNECNDDACGGPPLPLQSEILGFSVIPGAPYFIVVDGSNGAAGNYQISVTECSTGCLRDSDCSDSDPCTFDTCDIPTGNCVFPPAYAHGLLHCALDQAELSDDGSGNLVVSNIGSSGLDGVSIDLWETAGYVFERVECGPVAILSTFTMRVSGRLVGGATDQPLSSLSAEGVPGPVGTLVQITPDFSPLSATTYTSRLYSGDTLVFSQSGRTGPAVTLAPLAAGSDYLYLFGGFPEPASGSSDKRKQSLFFPELVALTIPGGPTIQADGLVLEPDDATVDIEFLARSEVVASGIPSFTLTDEAIGIFGLANRATGDAHLEPGGDHLTISNIGSSGLDGFAIDFEVDDAITPSRGGFVMDPIVTAETSIGGKLEIEAGDALFSSITSTRTGATSFDISVDYSAINPASLRVVTRDGGAVVADTVLAVPGAGVSIAQTSSSPLGGSSDNNGNNLNWNFGAGTTIQVSGGAAVTGDQLRFIPINPATPSTSFTSLRVRASDVTRLIITDETGDFCIDRSECSDSNRCSSDFCIAGTCSNAPAPDSARCELFEPGTYESPSASDKCVCSIGYGRGGSIYLYGGECTSSATDLSIRGRRLDFEWSRKYRSRVGVQPGSDLLGRSWDFSYNIWIEPVGLDIRLHDGNTREDTWARVEDRWEAGEHYRVFTLDQSDGSHILTFADSSTWRFRAFDGIPGEGRIRTITDRNGNELNFDYDAAGRLTTIHDSLDTAAHNRDITIAYNTDGFIESVTDFTGRRVRYLYYQAGETGGSAGDLKSVTTPDVTGVPNGNNFPNGKTTVYTYSTGFLDDRLNHNLLTITDPKGQTILTNEYASTQDPGDLNFDRVVRQVWGDAEDIIDLVYVPVAPAEGNGFAEIKVTVNDRMGNVSEYGFDGGNRLVFEFDYTGRADPDNPTNLSLPTPLNPPTNPLRATDPAFYETRYEWSAESLMTRTIYPNGNEVTQQYDEANSDRLHQADVLRSCQLPGSLGGDQTEICETYDNDAGFGGCGQEMHFVQNHTDARGATSVRTYDSFGNCTSATDRIPSIVEDYAYNQFGQMTQCILPDNGSGHRRRDVYVYYASGPQRGYLQTRVIDDDNFRLTTTYEYDILGRMTRVTDPRGHDDLYVINQLDQVVQYQTRETTAGGARYLQDYFRDENDNILRVCTENRDESGLLDPGNLYFTTIYEYDTLNYMTRTCTESGSVDVPRTPAKLDCGGLPATDFIFEEYEYDENRNMTLLRLPESVNGNQPNNTVTHVRDERDLLLRKIYAAGSSEQSTTRYDYDGNLLLTLRSTGIEDTAHITTYAYDGFNRMTRVTDPMGNAQRYTYDPNSNLLTIRTDGELDDVTGDTGNLRLSETRYVYDSINRLTLEGVSFFDAPTQSDISDGEDTTTYSYSDFSQITLRTDDNGNQTSYSYDAANRLTVLTDPKSNTERYTYDPNSNIITVFGGDLSDLGAAPQGFETTYVYDNLDRMTLITDSVGNRMTYGYDSRSNTTTLTDALGNETRYVYDSISRLTTSVRDMDGNGASESDLPDIVVRRRFDDDSRLIEIEDDNLHVTTYEYDILSRVTRQIYADATEHTYGYDAHFTGTIDFDPNGTTSTRAYDELNRITALTVIPGVGVSPDTTFELYRYDGLSRNIRAEDNDSVVTFDFDSLSRVVSETLNGCATTSSYDGVGNRLSCNYPGGRSLSYDYDARNRLTTVTDAGQAIPIASYAYVGPYRVEQRGYANGTQSDFTYDGIRGVANPPGDLGVKHLISTSHSLPKGGPFDLRVYLWDGMYNKTKRDDLTQGVPVSTHEYVYDSIYRLTRSTEGGDNRAAGDFQQVVYEYDGAGNRLTITGGSFGGAYCSDDGPGDPEMNQYTATPSDARTYDLNGNLIGLDPSQLCDTSTVEPPLPAPAPHDIRKNRFISFDPNNIVPIAVRVELLDQACSQTGKKCASDSECKICDGGENLDQGCILESDCPDAACVDSEETCDEQSPPVVLGWLDEPFEPATDRTPPGTFTAHVVNALPPLRVYTEAVVHIGDCEIAPVENYALSTTSNGIAYSPRVVFSTIEKPQGKSWTDTVGAFTGIEWTRPNGLVNVDDVSATIKFITVKPAPHITVVDIAGEKPNFLINVSDLQLMLLGFKGQTYPPPPFETQGPVTTCPIELPLFGSFMPTEELFGVYNFRNQPVAWIEPVSGRNTTYSYDVFGRRFEKSVTEPGAGNVVTRYCYSGRKCIEEQDVKGGTEASYVYGPEFRSDRLSMRRDGFDLYYHTDDIDNVMAMTGPSGAVVERYRYDDFGRIIVTGPAGEEISETEVGNLYLFGGRRLDPETGFHYHGRRYYDPEAGRYVQRAASGDGLGNRLTYAGNNPWSGGSRPGGKDQFLSMGHGAGSGGGGGDVGWWIDDCILESAVVSDPGFGITSPGLHSGGHHPYVRPRTWKLAVGGPGSSTAMKGDFTRGHQPGMVGGGGSSSSAAVAIQMIKLENEGFERRAGGGSTRVRYPVHFHLAGSKAGSAGGTVAHEMGHSFDAAYCGGGYCVQYRETDFNFLSRMIDDRRYRNLMTGRAPIYSATRGFNNSTSMSRQSSFLIRRNSSMMNQRFDVVRPRGGTASGKVFPKVEIHVTASYQTGKRIHNAMSIVKVFDKSTPKLLEKLNMGEVIPKLEIELTSTKFYDRSFFPR